MNETIIKNWNERVKDGDTVFHLGDFCFKEKDGIKAQDWMDRLNGNMILIKGNHDKDSSAKTIINSLIIDLGGKIWWMEHHPFNSTYEYNLTAHVHNLWQIMMVKHQIYYNCGVDMNGFRPINIQEIMANIDTYKRNKVKPDNILS